jgi:hypothetical protein
LGGNFVLFYVGEDEDEASVHEKKLREHSQLFDNAFRLSHSELLPFLQHHLGERVSLSRYTRGIRLKHFHFRIKDMNTLIEWLYCSSLPTAMKFKDFCCLYYLASKFQMHKLLSELIDYIQTRHLDSGNVFGPTQISHIFENRDAGGGQLWEYCAKQIIGCLIWGKKRSSWVSKFEEVCKVNPDLGPALFQVLLTSGRSIYQEQHGEACRARSSERKTKKSKEGESPEVDESEVKISRKVWSKKGAPRRSIDKKDRYNGQRRVANSVLEANEIARRLAEDGGIA